MAAKEGDTPIFVNDDFTCSYKGPAPQSFIAWKAVRYNPPSIGSSRKVVIVKLLITKGTLVNIQYQGKCRTAQARVLDIQHKVSTTKTITNGTAYSDQDWSFVYRLGAIVKPKNIFDQSTKECSSGIHFFMDRKAAVKYLY